MDHHLEWIERAREAGADLLMFPETSLTGHWVGPETPNCAVWRDGPELEKLAVAAGDMAVCVGLIEEAPGGLFYNGQAILCSGRVLHIHRKINLATFGRMDEGKYFAKGNTVERVEIAGWRVVTMICNDVYNPGLVHLAMMGGCDLLLISVSSALEAVGDGFDNPASWGMTVPFYAMVYATPVVMANRVWTDVNATYWGGSSVTAPGGTTLAAARDREELILATVGYDAYRAARFALPSVRDGDLPLIHREAARLLGIRNNG